ncbi:MAG: FG-GAP-like repeat-containing protein [Bacteroidia bacterium]|nr:FG-GAP-like repeat-containing protein [Bacteroidia bacterium]
MRYFSLISLLFLALSCKNKDQNPEQTGKRFVLMDAAITGISFSNTVLNTEDFNIFSYRNFYNGGGVAIGDINNDGLSDIYLTSNMGANKLFLNKGDWKFEDISAKAGIEDATKWSTGVVFVDINNDGWLDIYVCNAGYRKGVGQENSLFINNQNLTFTESAASFGLDENGYTTHAGFFDYDLDGDLDVYILNNSFIPVNTLNFSNKRELRAEEWPVKDFLKGGGDKLLRNDNGKFTDVSESAGIYGSLIGFGLGVTIGDVNNDKYPDIYISNDFFERDYLYINQQNGTFSEKLTESMEHISHSSMGADMADINNDGLPEIFVTDMLPDDEYRLKTTTSFDNINQFKLKQERGFYNQYMHNTLQLNEGDNQFREISWFSGVQASDWSWGALMFDADNDSYADIYVCNGIYHDVIDQDFIDFFANEVIQKMALTGKKEEMNEVINKMPSKPLPNKFFQNKGNLRFEDTGENWGFTDKSFSNGAAYGDLDNDGDLDLVVNNVNQEAFVYQNFTDKLADNHYFGISLEGTSENRFAVGAKIEVFAGGKNINRQMIPTRGFQSSVDYKMPIGLGTTTLVDSLQITWPDSKISVFYRLPVDTFRVFRYADQTFQDAKPENSSAESKLFIADTNPFDAHQEDDHIDFYYEGNIPVMLSQQGPCAAVADVNGDGLEDIFIGGAAGQAGQLYIGTNKGFVKKNSEAFVIDANSEDTAAAFFDSDGDGDLDLFVGSGGNNHPYRDRRMQDRIYINDGKGNFRAEAFAFPPNGMNTSVAAPYDFDEDGDMDIFVGSQSVPMEYGLNPSNYLYLNNGSGRFTDIARTENEIISLAGMVTDAAWIDLVGGPHKELVLVGDWMGPKIFMYNGKNFQEVATNLNEHQGWWSALAANDVDHDGDMDMLLGNLGENFYLKAEKDSPLKLWINDFDKNQTLEKIITRTLDGKDMPVPLKRDLTLQIVSLKQQNLKHVDYATKSIQDLFPKETLDQSLVKQTNYLKTCVAINNGNGQFEIRELEPEIQLSCINDAAFADLNGDGFDDLILGGNNYDFLPQFSRLDASWGHVLLNDQKGNFAAIPFTRSGLKVKGEVRQISLIKEGNKQRIIFLLNNQKPVTYLFPSGM